MALPRRSPGRERRSGLRPGITRSALLHLGLAALAVLASSHREKPSEPLPPPAYAVEFEAGAPDRPAEPEASLASPPDAAETPPQEAPALEPPVAALEPPTPEVVPAPRDEAAQQPPPPQQPTEAQTAEAAPSEPEELPGPPPQAPPQPQREAALTAPPRPARPPPSERLPGLYLPEARDLQPQRPVAPRRGLDLSPGQLPQTGRDSPEAELRVREGRVGPDWRNAFRRWMDEHGRYPTNAAVVGEQGTTTIELIIDPDGRVRSGRLLRRSGSVWLDAGTVSLFRNAVLPPLPAGSEPSGLTLELTIKYILYR